MSDPLMRRALRNIALAEAFVSLMSLQCVTLASFPSMTQESIRLMNALTGAGVNKTPPAGNPEGGVCFYRQMVSPGLMLQSVPSAQLKLTALLRAPG